MSNRGKEPDTTTIQLERSTLRWGSLVIGVIALLVMVITLIITPQFEFNTVSYAALAVAVVGIAGFVLFDPQALASAITGRRGQYLLSSYLLTIFFVAAVIAIFVVIRAANWEPITIGENSQYRISDETLEVLDQLEEPIEILAFYGRQAAPTQREEAEIWLNAYERESDGMVTYQFIDPDREPVLAAEYNATGGGSTIVVTQGERTADVFFPNERNLTTGIVQVLLGEPQTVYFVTGHGERNIAGFQPDGYGTLANSLETANYTVEEIDLLTVEEVPDDADVLVIAGPVSQFVAPEIEVLDEYLSRGGGLVVLADPGGETGALAGGIRTVAFSPDGDVIATGGNDATVKLWDAASQEELFTLRGHTGEVLNIAFSPDGSQVATIGADSTVRVWDAETGEEIEELVGHELALAGDIAYSPDGSVLASAAEDGTINVWNTDGYTELPYSPIEPGLSLFTVTFSPDSQTILAGGGQSVTPEAAGQGVLYGYTIADGVQQFDERLHGDAIFGVEVIPAAEATVVEETEEGDAEAEATVEDVIVQTIAVDSSIGTYSLTEQNGSTVSTYEPSMTALAVAPDGTRAFGLISPGSISIRLWPAGDTSDDNEIVLEGPTDIIWDIDFSSDSETVVVASRNGTLYLYDVTDPEAEPTTIVGPHASVDPLLTYLESAWAIEVGDDLIVDIATASELGSEFAPVIRDYGPSPITDGLDQQRSRIFLLTGHSVRRTLLPPEEVTPTEIAFTTDTVESAFGVQVFSWAETSDPLNTQVQYDEGIDLPGPQPVAVQAENNLTNARVVVVGDADIGSNNALNFTNFANQRFILNMLNWASEADAALDLPEPPATTRELDQPFDAAGLTLVRIATTCLLPLAIVVAGIITWVQRRRRR